MGFAIASDALLSAVVATGFAVGILAAVMLAVLVAMRIQRRIRMRRERLTIERWRGVFAECIVGVPESLPRAAGRDHYALLRLYNYQQQVLRGAAAANLAALARNAQFHVVARAMLRRNVRYRLLGALTLGNMRDQESWDALLPLLEDRSTWVSLVAARALVQLQPARATTRVVDAAASRDDWHVTALAVVLREIGADLLTPPLVQAIGRLGLKELPGRHLVRLLHLLELGHPQLGADVVRRVLRMHGGDAEITMACLRALSQPQDAALLREYARDARWAVRAIAAQRLGRVGGAEDRRILTAMLDDPQWWARHSAARALRELGVIDLAVDGPEAAITPRARLTLEHVLAEHSLA